MYGKLRKILSLKNKSRLTKFLYYSGLKPKVNKKKKGIIPKGVVVFSADFEMAWAFRYSKKKQDKANEMGLLERENIPVLLELFEKYNIPITWAAVGHLFLSECHKVNGKPHNEMPRPGFFENKNWRFEKGDWYDSDPCSDYKSEPAWYASDLIDLILNSKVKHEIGCHTFSHSDFTYKNCSEKLADAEIKKCIELANKRGIKLESFVFPGGTFGNYEVLKRNGIINYRKPMKYHVDFPYIDEYGLVVIPSSLGLDKDDYGWTRDFHLRIFNNFLEKVIKYKLVCHFWFHPSLNEWYLKEVFPGLLKKISDYRNEDELEVLTMAELSKRFIK